MCQDPEILVLEMKLSKINWLIIGTYKPSSLNNFTFTSEITNIRTLYWSSDENISLIKSNALLTTGWKYLTYEIERSIDHRMKTSHLWNWTLYWSSDENISLIRDFNPIRPRLRKLTWHNLKWPRFWNRSTYWSHILWLLVLKHYAQFLKEFRWATLCLCRCTHVVQMPYPQLKIQDIGFAAITDWTPKLMNSFVDTNKYALVCSFCQHHNLGMVS